MTTTLEKRVAKLEKQMAALIRKRTQRPVGKTDWRSAVGMLDDTPLAREADALGEAYRSAQRHP